MAGRLRVMLEIGPKGKRTVAVAPDWPGLSRGAITADEAINRLVSYRPRYAPVAAVGMEAEFTANSCVEVVERCPGVRSSDVSGISIAFSGLGSAAISSDQLDRELRLMRADWALLFVTVTRRNGENAAARPQSRRERAPDARP
jgi:hypothetical protein